MIPLTAAEVAEATGGYLVDADPNARVIGVSTDSRSVSSGDLFVAIVGETYDAHAFVADAIESGATLALVSRPVDGPSVVVDDTVVALGRLARAVLDRLPKCRVVAITGSSGKTSTKDLIARVLSSAGTTIAPPGSFNNEIGLPTTALRADHSTEYLVMEMGMRGFGHIAYLCTVAPPSVAVVTNVGSAHLELLGSREGIAQAKGEIVEALPTNGIAVLNGDDPLVLTMRQRTAARVMTFGEKPGNDVRAVDIVLDDLARPSFTLTAEGASAPVQLQLHGRHHVSNALAAASVGVAEGMSVAGVADVLSRAETDSKWRMEVRRTAGGTIVVNDAYNANPESMAAALDALASMAERDHGTRRRTWAVVGEMREIGEGGVEAHRRVGEVAAQKGIDHLVAVGEGARPTYASAVELMGSRAQWVPDPEAAVAALGELGPDDVVLVKASRAIGLERVANTLLTPANHKDGEL